jgi:hypothetical protein
MIKRLTLKLVYSIRRHCKTATPEDRGYEKYKYLIRHTLKSTKLFIRMLTLCVGFCFRIGTYIVCEIVGNKIDVPIVKFRTGYQLCLDEFQDIIFMQATTSAF